MNQEIDARGLACPKPVIMAKKALDAIISGEIITIVDNENAVDNIRTMVANSNYDINVEQKNNDYYIRINKKGIMTSKEDLSTANIVVLISKATIGQGNDQLGHILMKNFLYALLENDEKPKSIIFVNGGVLLPCQDSELLENLMALEKEGVEILSCGTCLDFYQIKQNLCVGQISNMYTIVEKMTKSDKVINI